MSQLPSINDNIVNLWKKLLINSEGFSPTPPPVTDNFLFTDNSELLFTDSSNFLFT